MECGKIRGLLTSYLEKTITPEQRLLVEDHLSSCEECKTALEELRRTVALLKDLEEVEPPPWLTRKIMAQVKEEAGHKGGLLRWLFYPLRVKLPLQAFATILIVIMAAFVYKSTEPQFQSAKMSRETERALRQDDRVPSPQSDERVAAPVIKDLDSASEAQRNREEPLRASQERSMANQGPAAAGRRQLSPEESIDSQPAYEPKAALTMPAQRPPAPAQEDFARPHPIAQKAPAPESGSAAEPKSERAALTVRVTDVQDAAIKIEKFLGEEAAHQVKRESRVGRESISAELQGDRVDDLLRKLRTIGDTRGFASGIPSGETVTIRIDLLDEFKADEPTR